MRAIRWICFVFIFCWGGAFLLFLSAFPTRATPADVQSHAIIVLTGGSERVERGFAMLAEGAAPVLLISGVGRDVKLHEMLAAHATQEIRDAISARGAIVVLDYIANTTETNAREASQFIRERKFTSIRLITADYHMPRAIAEFQGALPGVEIVPDAVFPKSFHRDAWWKHKNTRWLVLSEYHKTIAVYARRIIPWLRQA